MGENDLLLGELKGEVAGLSRTVGTLVTKIDQMLSAHAACRQELSDRIFNQDERLKKQEERLDGYVKKAVLICLTLILGGQIGPDIIKKIVEVVGP